MKVAFIGIGNMGSGMARNLVRAGVEVRGYDIRDEALSAARANGCIACTSSIDAVQGVEAVITMLPDGPVVEEVYRESVLGHAPHSAILIDCSTTGVASALRLAELSASSGYQAVDAPVSGGIAAAAQGTLTFMVGGDEGMVARAEPFLRPMGRAVIHAGASGAGQAAKVCNNMLLGIHMLGTCEAFALAERLGLDLAKFYEISSISTGQTWSMTNYCPVPGVGPQSPADNDYRAGFSARLMLKDLALASAAALETGERLPMGERARELYEAFVADGNGEIDFSAVFRTL